MKQKHKQKLKHILKQIIKPPAFLLLSLPVTINYLLHNKNKFPDELAVVAIVKNEAAYIAEWIEYHRLVGVTKFYIYDNGSEDNLTEVLRPYIDSGVVSYTFYPGVPCPQVKAYNEAIREYRNKAKWIAFIDIDEFIVPMIDKTRQDKTRQDKTRQDKTSYTSIIDVLNEVETRYKHKWQFAALAVNWVIYGYSGHETKPEGLVIENYTESAGIIKCVKVIVNPRTVLRFYIHHAIHFWFVSERHMNMKPAKLMKWSDDADNITKIRINHYATKSYQEYARRRKKNAAGHGNPLYFFPTPPLSGEEEAVKKSWNDALQLDRIPNIPDMVMTEYIEPVRRALAENKSKE